MRIKRSYLVLMGLVLLMAAPSIASAKTLTYVDLVKQLTDLTLLAEKPQVGEKTLMVSSYDRRSRYDAVNDKYIDWDADADGNGVVRMEGKEAVLADLQGPGCIVRIWSATAAEGHVKIFIDGSALPAVDLPFSSYFDGKHEPFTQPALVYKTTGGNTGYDNYTPIPFQHRCEIVADPGWGRYYQINYRSFSAGTVVPTFTGILSKVDTDALAGANTILSEGGAPVTSQLPGQLTEDSSFTVAPGKSKVVFDKKGPAAITRMRVRFQLPVGVEAQRTFLRQLALRITWDGQTQPSVWSPWGDFFGDSNGATAFQSLPVGLGQDGFWYSDWYMPYATRAVVCVDNDSAVPVNMTWEVTHARLLQPAGTLLRFHAKWHRDEFLPARADRKIDWTLLVTRGEGRYVGTQLDVATPRGGWWGEGDEKLFTDGEKFPSDFGTGTEDYFGGAWGLGSVFDKAFHGISAIAPFGRGYVSAHRWHIVDNVPFQKSFEGDIEKYYPNDTPSFTRYAAVSYWYLNATGIDPYPVVPVGQRTGYWNSPPIYHEAGAIEGEDLSVLKLPPDDSVYPFDALFLWIPPQVISNDKVLCWTTQKKDRPVALGFKTAQAGRYHVWARFLHKDNAGIYQMAVNGQNIGLPVDLYGPPQGDQAELGRDAGGSISYATVTEPVDLGSADIVAGDNTLSATLVGENSESLNDGSDRVFYLDYIKLIPAAK